MSDDLDALVLFRPAVGPRGPGPHAYRSLPEVTRYLGHPPLHLAGMRQLVDRWLADPVTLSVGLELAGEVVGDVRLWCRPSSALLRRLGFHLDGVDRAAVLAPDGSTWWDDETWSLLREEWGGRAGR